MNKNEAIHLIRYISGALIRLQSSEKDVKTCEEFLKNELDFFVDKLDEAYDVAKEQEAKSIEIGTEK